MNTTIYLHVAIILIFATTSLGLDIRVLTGLNIRGLSSKPDFGEQKIVINSNNRYIYPSEQVPQYNVYTLPTLYYNRNFLEVVSNNYVYPILIIDRRPNQPPVYQLVHPFTRQIMEQVNEPIYIKPFDKMQYLIEEQPFNIGGFAFSGTGLFLIGGVFLYLCYKSVMPKLEEAQMAPEGTQE